MFGVAGAAFDVQAPPPLPPVPPLPTELPLPPPPPPQASRAQMGSSRIRLVFFTFISPRWLLMMLGVKPRVAHPGFMFCVALEFNCARWTAGPKIRLNLMTSSHRGTAWPQPKKQSGKNRPLKSKLLLSPRGLRTFRARLLAWYDANKRDLPWRVTKDAYCIWLSEIMLQQTRVAVVKEYYPRFLKRFPTIAALAGARLSSVLAAWSGLGYYRRA